MNRLALVTFIVMSTQLTFAQSGQIGSGGGNEIVCFDTPSIPQAIRNPQNPNFEQITDEQRNHITSIEAFDLYLAKMPRGFAASLPELTNSLPGEGPRKFVRRQASRFDWYFPWLNTLISDGENYFPDDHITMRTDGITRVHDEHDSGYISQPNCVLATVAYQSDGANGDGYLDIDGRLFMSDKQSDLSRNVLFLHEAIYARMRVGYGATSSESTRKLIGLILLRALSVGVLHQAWYDLGLMNLNRWACLASLDPSEHKKMGCEAHPYDDKLRDYKLLMSAIDVYSTLAYVNCENQCKSWEESGALKRLALPTQLESLVRDLLNQLKWNGNKFDRPIQDIGWDDNEHGNNQGDIWGPVLLNLQIPPN